MIDHPIFTEEDAKDMGELVLGALQLPRPVVTVTLEAAPTPEPVNFGYKNEE